MQSPAPAPVQAVEDVGVVAAKYGIMAIFGPVVVMLVVNFLRVKVFQGNPGVLEAEATRVNVELARMGSSGNILDGRSGDSGSHTRAMAQVRPPSPVIADDTDDDDHGDSNAGIDGAGRGSRGASGGRPGRGRGGWRTGWAAGDDGAAGDGAASDPSSSSSSVDSDQLVHGALVGASRGEGGADDGGGDDDSSSDLPDSADFDIALGSGGNNDDSDR